jgi:ABC-type sulfate transport system permease component
MSMLVWVMTALAIWHFTVFLPDHFWGGIVGALLCAIAGAAIVGLLLSGFTVPGRSDTELVQALVAVPGTLIGLAFAYLYGRAQDRRAGIERYHV